MGKWIDKKFIGAYIHIDLSNSDFEKMYEKNEIHWNDAICEKWEEFAGYLISTDFDKIFSFEFEFDGSKTELELIECIKSQYSELINHLKYFFGDVIMVKFGVLGYSENI